MQIIKGESLDSKNWGGGETTELFIFPDSAKYNQLDFQFRISIATIEIEKSTFTTLPFVKRELMVTEGTLKLLHKNKYNRLLKPFESDTFSGNWHTTSFGKAKDFNLMMLGDTEGYLEHISTSPDKIVELTSNCEFLLLYCLDGTISIENNELTDKDLIIIKGPKAKTVFHFSENSSAIVARIWLNSQSI